MTNSPVTTYKPTCLFVSEITRFINFSFNKHALCRMFVSHLILLK
jgi:hypothetical protein